MATNHKELLNESETAHFLGLSRSYLRKARMTGDLSNRKPAPRFLKIGRSIRYKIADLNEWISSLGSYEHSIEVNHMTKTLPSQSADKNATK